MPRSTSKTKTPHQIAAADSREAYATARTQHAAAVEARSAHQVQLAEWTEAVEWGSGTPDQAAGLRALRESLADMDALVLNTRRRVEQARQTILSETTELADALAPVLSNHLGMTVRCVNERPSKAPTSLPVAYLVQRHISRPNLTEGHLSGRVVLHVVRDAKIHREAVDDDIAAALAAGGILLGTPARSVADYELDGAVVDRIELQVASAWPLELPVIAGPVMPNMLAHYARCLAGTVQDGLWTPELAPISGVRMQGQESIAGQSRPMPSVRATGSATLAGEDAQDNVRTLIVDTLVTVRSSGRGGRSRTIAENVAHLRRVIEQQVGTHAGTFGRVNAVEILGAGPSSSGGAEIRARMTFTSRTPAA